MITKSIILRPYSSDICSMKSNKDMDKIILTTISIDELINAISNKVSDIINKNGERKITTQNTEINDFLTRTETAELCRIKSLTTLWNWEQNGKLVPKIKAGKKPLYIRQDVIDFLERRDSG